VITPNRTLGFLIGLMSVMLISMLAFADVQAAEINVSMQLPITRVDGTPFDPLTESQSIDIGCGLSSTGPFDVFLSSYTGPFESIDLSFNFVSPEDRDYWCIAYLTDTGGRVSGPSNVALLDYIVPPSSLKILDMQDVSSGGKLNFSFTIGIN
jgi:hypothetical protein